MLPSAVSEHYRAQQRLIVSTLALTRREWAKMGNDFDTSWRTVGPRLLLLTSAAQRGAAVNGAQYIPLALEQIGTPVDPVGQVSPDAFSGWASDGRPLDTLLYGGVTTAKQQILQGASAAEALAVGGRWLDMAIHTQVADAARQSAAVGIAARPKIGYRRMVNPPCCSRCAILAGKWFKWNQGFQRHPRCDCTHIPAAEDAPGNIGTDPDLLFSSGQVQGLSDAQRKAIKAGADPAQVMNAYRVRRLADGSYVRSVSPNGLYTSEGTTRRGYASYIKREIDRQRGLLTRETATKVGPRGAVKNYTVRRIGPRPTPDAIFRYATSREDAIQLLAANGYIVGDIRKIAESAL